jgi:hypothetical protein
MVIVGLEVLQQHGYSPAWQRCITESRRGITIAVYSGSLAPRPAKIIEIFHDFPQSLHANIRIVSQTTGKNRI